MNSPEVVNFEPPRTLLQSWTSPRNAISQRIASGVYGDQFFSITIVLPDVPRIPEHITNSFDDQIYYQVFNFPISQLVEPEFLETFIKNGSLAARTINNWMDVDDSCILHSSGILELSVGRDVYQELGLTGRVNLTFAKKPANYTIKIDLLEEGFKSGSKIHQRVLWCLKDRLDLKYDWVIKWKPHDPEVCLSSLAAYLDFRNFKVQQCKPQFNLNRLYGLTVPQISDKQTESVDIQDLVEWVGMTTLGIECPTEANFASSVACPEPQLNVGQVAVLSWQGFFIADETIPLFESVTNLIKEVNGPSWFNITFHGFDSAAGKASEMITLFTTPSSKCHCLSLTFPTNKIK